MCVSLPIISFSLQKGERRRRTSEEEEEEEQINVKMTKVKNEDVAAGKCMNHLNEGEFWEPISLVLRKKKMMTMVMMIKYKKLFAHTHTGEMCNIERERRDCE